MATNPPASQEAAPVGMLSAAQGAAASFAPVVLPQGLAAPFAPVVLPQGLAAPFAPVVLPQGLAAPFAPVNGVSNPLIEALNREYQGLSPQFKYILHNIIGGAVKAAQPEEPSQIIKHLKDTNKSLKRKLKLHQRNAHLSDKSRDKAKEQLNEAKERMNARITQLESALIVARNQVCALSQEKKNLKDVRRELCNDSQVAELNATRKKVRYLEYENARLREENSFLKSKEKSVPTSKEKAARAEDELRKMAVQLLEDGVIDVSVDCVLADLGLEA